MTEQEWLKQPGAYAMFEFISSRTPSARKLRLFAVGCCHRIWHLVSDERHRKAVIVAEQFADELATREQMQGAYHAAIAVGHTFQPPWNTDAIYHAAWATIWTASEASGAIWDASTEATKAVRSAVREGQPDEDAVGPERAKQAHLLREIFGNPFRPVTINPAWLTWNDGMVRKIAQSIYDDRGYDKMPILADALEEAGCDNKDILDHCRNAGPHVKGCFVIDLLLGKE